MLEQFIFLIPEGKLVEKTPLIDIEVRVVINFYINSKITNHV